MCLEQKLSDRSLQRYKAKGKKTGYIRVWKIVDERPEKYYPLIWNEKPFSAGLNFADVMADFEHELIHAYKTKRGCVRDGWHGKLVLCLVKPEWIKAISKKALTTKAIVMPAYPKCKVTVAEFWAAIKGKKVKKYSWE